MRNHRNIIFFILFLSLLVNQQVVAQTTLGNHAGDQYKKTADSLGNKDDFARAAMMYMRESSARTMDPFKKSALVNAAYCYAASKNRDSALLALELATYKYGFNNLSFLTGDSMMQTLASHNKFKKIIQQIRLGQQKQKNVKKAIINTSDIDLFWNTYDRFLKDTANGVELFQINYFEKGTPALQEYFRIKTRNIGGIKGFVQNMKKMPSFYASIRANTFKISSLKDTIRMIYQNLKHWYSDAIFPPLSFHIGGWSSGGTATDYGLHVGADMYANNPDTDKSALNAWQKRNSYLFGNLKYVVAHELIHAQQGNMREDTILLKHVIQEGMADFIGELISGNTANAFLINWAKGNEQRIWDAFKKEMYLDRYSNWIANSSQEKPDWPADLGYWVGYKICKSYFKNAADKKKAIYEMLHIQSYQAFYEKSQVETMIYQK